VPFQFKWTEEFTPVANISTRVDVIGTLDNASRAALGLAQPAWISGRIPVTLALTGLRFNFEDAVLHADLANAAIDYSSVNIVKKPGTKANAVARIHFGEQDSLLVQDLVLDGTGIDVRGQLMLDANREVVSASLSTVRVGDSNDFALTIEPLPGGGSSMRI